MKIGISLRKIIIIIISLEYRYVICSTYKYVNQEIFVLKIFKVKIFCVKNFRRKSHAICEHFLRDIYIYTYNYYYNNSTYNCVWHNKRGKCEFLTKLRFFR